MIHTVAFSKAWANRLKPQLATRPQTPPHAFGPKRHLRPSAPQLWLGSPQMAPGRRNGREPSKRPVKFAQRVPGPSPSSSWHSACEEFLFRGGCHGRSESVTRSGDMPGGGYSRVPPRTQIETTICFVLGVSGLGDEWSSPLAKNSRSSPGNCHRDHASWLPSLRAVVNLRVSPEARFGPHFALWRRDIRFGKLVASP